MDNHESHQQTIEDAFSVANSGAAGLSSNEAKKRLSAKGLNKLPEEKALTGLILFLGQFKNPLVFILLVALVISYFAGYKSDALIIFVVIMVTNIIGFFQEWKANNALKKLSGLVVYKSKVWRDGHLAVIDREQLVPGDVIEFTSGDVIPADARIFELKNLKINEAPLTGESLPVTKNLMPLAGEVSLADRKNMVYQGTIVADGSGRALITATGQETEIGKVAKLIKETSDGLTPLQKQINKFGMKLGLFLIVANIIIFFIGILTGRDPFEMFMITVVIVVSAVPEGLIPAMAIILAIGMQRLVKKKGLVRRAVAAETLGSVSVICVDKTGTLTQGEMMVDRLVSGSKELIANKKSEALRIGVLCNDGLVENPGERFDKLNIIGNPTDKALLLAGASLGWYRQELEVAEPRLDILPFSSDIKLMATLHRLESGKEVIYIKGAPEKIIALASHFFDGKTEKKLTKADKDIILKKIEELTGTGARVLAIASKVRIKSAQGALSIDELKGLSLTGLFSLRDQIRPDVKNAIQSCREAGIRVVIITGDHENTAIAIAREIGFKIDKHNVVNGSELDKMTDEELKSRIREIRLYARVSPHHKLRIVGAFQEIGKVVAMTGDGINDSPALKKADIGVAVGNGTDVAKEVADLVLLDNSFLTIVEAVRQGRVTFSNIQKVILYLFTDCFQEMIVICSAILMGWPLPILPAQILWNKLIEDPLPAASLAFDDSDIDVMKDKPRHRNQPFLTVGLQKVIAFYAIIMNVAALSIFYYYWRIIGDLDLARSVMFATLGLSTMFYVYAVRSLRQSVFKTNILNNKFLMYAAAIGALLVVSSIYLPFLNKLLNTVPLAPFDWLVAVSYGFLSIMVFEVGKRIFDKHHGR